MAAAHHLEGKEPRSSYVSIEAARRPSTQSIDRSIWETRSHAATGAASKEKRALSWSWAGGRAASCGRRRIVALSYPGAARREEASSEGQGWLVASILFMHHNHDWGSTSIVGY